MSDDLVVPPRLRNGCIPPGRWRVTENEAFDAYASGRDGDREAIWQEWRDLTTVLQDVFGGIAVCWLSGSFFTDKPTPADIDCLYIIDSPAIFNLDADDGKRALAYAAASQQVKQLFGLRVDPYLLGRIAWSPPRPVGQEADDYLRRRGYWDELWSLMRDGDPIVARRPRRGYLEIVIDGYR